MQSNRIYKFMADHDAYKEALDQVERVTGSERVKGDDLLESPTLRRQLREAKERISEANRPKDGQEGRKS
jgi:hypothetical protein